VQFTDVLVGDRLVVLSWNRAPSDTISPEERGEIHGLSFGRYHVWRSEDPNDIASFKLLRTFSVFDLPFDRTVPEIGEWWPFGEPEVKDQPFRFFSDPFFVFSHGASLNPNDLEFLGACCVHNGFNYYYSITYDDAFLDLSTGAPRPVFVQKQTIEEGMLRDPATGKPLAVEPGKPAREESPLLAGVSVVPNPFNRRRAYAQAQFPGEDRVQFVNLPLRCSIDIYTAAGDKIRTLEHDSAADSENWDLRNQNGEDVSSGVYLFFVRAEGQEADGRFVIIR
jgi:hypothetical protein